MRILLLGEFSNIHWTLAEGLRHLGHEVCVLSNGNGWKNYPRDIDLSRASDGKDHVTPSTSDKLLQRSASPEY